ncbi:MAG: CHAP domain-containing protein [Candidatus Gastranaerophilales bacterium]|nr:CHAP domain-containing protein [Candidatus Gastranaerophilales bacterium]
MQINNTDPFFSGKNLKTNDTSSTAKESSANNKYEEDIIQTYRDSGYEIYDREDKNRDAIVDHDKYIGINGMSDWKEGGTSGVTLDLNKYRDLYGYMIDENNDENGYMNTVAQEIEKDLANYFEINPYEEGGKEDLNSVMKQILKHRLCYDEPQNLDTDAYNAYVAETLAKISNNDTLDDDYIYLDGIEVGFDPLEDQTEDASQTASNKTESGLEKRTVDDDSASKVLALAESYEGKESEGDFTKPFFGRVNYVEFDETTPWCAAFASYVTLESGADVADWFENMNGSAGCGEIYTKALEKSAIVSYEDVQPGDLIIYDDPNCYYGETRADDTIDYSMDHIGIVTSKDGEYFSTIEGNTGYSDTCTNGKVAKHEGLNINDYGTTHDQSDYGSKRVYFVRVLK